jgi:hypothetical protein
MVKAIHLSYSFKLFSSSSSSFVLTLLCLISQLKQSYTTFVQITISLTQWKLSLEQNVPEAYSQSIVTGSLRIPYGSRGYLLSDRKADTGCVLAPINQSVFIYHKGVAQDLLLTTQALIKSIVNCFIM